MNVRSIDGGGVLALLVADFTNPPRLGLATRAAEAPGLAALAAMAPALDDGTSGLSEGLHRRIQKAGSDSSFGLPPERGGFCR